MKRRRDISGESEDAFDAESTSAAGGMELTFSGMVQAIQSSDASTRLQAVQWFRCVLLQAVFLVPKFVACHAICRIPVIDLQHSRRYFWYLWFFWCCFGLNHVPMEMRPLPASA
jgi:hypothetical protein